MCQYFFLKIAYSVVVDIERQIVSVAFDVAHNVQKFIEIYLVLESEVKQSGVSVDDHYIAFFAEGCVLFDAEYSLKDGLKSQRIP